MTRELDRTEIKCPLSQPLFDFLTSFVTGWPWWVYESTPLSVTIRTALPSATHGPCAWFDVLIHVDPLGRVASWSTWERKRTHIDHGRASFETHMAELLGRSGVDTSDQGQVAP